jgi:hypothetical protein
MRRRGLAVTSPPRPTAPEVLDERRDCRDLGGDGRHNRCESRNENEDHEPVAAGPRAAFNSSISALHRSDLPPRPRRITLASASIGPGPRRVIAQPVSASLIRTRPGFKSRASGSGPASSTRPRLGVQKPLFMRHRPTRPQEDQRLIRDNGPLPLISHQSGCPCRRSGPIKVARSTAQMIEKAGSAARPDRVDVEFGLKFSVSGTVIMAGVAGEASLKVTLGYDVAARPAGARRRGGDSTGIAGSAAGTVG